MCFVGLSISIREPKREFSFVFPFEVSVYQYPSENQNAHAPASRRTFVSVYQYPSENQNYRGRQCPRFWYQFINIHQRTKTIEGGSVRAFGISLSISIREPKQMNTPESVLNVSVYQYPSENQNPTCKLVRNAQVSVYQYPSENQNSDAIIYFTSSVSVYQYPSENQNHRSFAPPCLAYQFINIHQRTKTYLPLYFNYLSISLSISIREPKPLPVPLARLARISLSISIREPKPSRRRSARGHVSVYQYPSENQN